MQSSFCTVNCTLKCCDKTRTHFKFSFFSSAKNTHTRHSKDTTLVRHLLFTYTSRRKKNLSYPIRCNIRCCFLCCLRFSSYKWMLRVSDINGNLRGNDDINCKSGLSCILLHLLFFTTKSFSPLSFSLSLPRLIGHLH